MSIPPQFHDPYFHERTRIEADIQSLEKRLQDLRATRNSFLPISTLPHDVLCWIFQIAKTERHCIEATTTHRLTWVCRHWREIALGFPSLWVDVDPSLGPSWFRVHLERSKEANLSAMIWNGDNLNIPTMANQLVPQMHRISDLIVENTGIDLAEDRNSIMVTPAPALRSLEMQDVVLPQIFFSGVAPLLKWVSLTYFTGFRFSTIPFSSITDLTLDHPKPKLSLSYFLENIISFPHLQRLTLSSALYESPDPVSPEWYHSAQSHFPNIRHVALTDTPFTIAVKLFTYVPIHDELETKVIFYNPNVEKEQEYIQPYLRLVSLLRFFEPTRYPQLVVSRNKLELTSASSSGAAARFITAERGIFSWPSLVQILEQSNLESLQSLKYCSFEALSSPILDSIFWRLPNLRNLEVVGIGATFLIAHLANLEPSSLDYKSANDVANGPLPALRRLVLQDIKSDDLPNKDVITLFCGVLALRKKLGFGPEEVVIIKLPQSFLTDQLASMCADSIRVEEVKPENLWM
ncbi:hypothetical protein BDN72DRAFT_846446 [Pluteus cervinus]|uniref:Uncharacterized protein n=1 Tax=Pluteus cervinus TaxID=181527 RepID=A0ACD3AGR6_9AGAR|nr:hypothetical protein BDN72DRAFT_846446 [Pluteus cervinus]